MLNYTSLGFNLIRSLQRSLSHTLVNPSCMLSHGSYKGSKTPQNDTVMKWNTDLIMRDIKNYFLLGLFDTFGYIEMRQARGTSFNALCFMATVPSLVTYHSLKPIIKSFSQFAINCFEINLTMLVSSTRIINCLKPKICYVIYLETRKGEESSYSLSYSPPTMIKFHFSKV